MNKKLPLTLILVLISISITTITSSASLFFLFLCRFLLLFIEPSTLVSCWICLEFCRIWIYDFGNSRLDNSNSTWLFLKTLNIGSFFAFTCLSCWHSITGFLLFLFFGLLFLLIFLFVSSSSSTSSSIFLFLLLFLRRMWGRLNCDLIFLLSFWVSTPIAIVTHIFSFYFINLIR